MSHPPVATVPPAAAGMGVGSLSQQGKDELVSAARRFLQQGLAEVERVVQVLQLDPVPLPPDEAQAYSEARARLSLMIHMLPPAPAAPGAAAARPASAAAGVAVDGTGQGEGPQVTPLPFQDAVQRLGPVHQALEVLLQLLSSNFHQVSPALSRASSSYSERVHR